jgi:hypothetical protein
MTRILTKELLEDLLQAVHNDEVILAEIYNKNDVRNLLESYADLDASETKLVVRDDFIEKIMSDVEFIDRGVDKYSVTQAFVMSARKEQQIDVSVKNEGLTNLGNYNLVFSSKHGGFIVQRDFQLVYFTSPDSSGLVSDHFISKAHVKRGFKYHGVNMGSDIRRLDPEAIVLLRADTFIELQALCDGYF